MEKQNIFYSKFEKLLGENIDADIVNILIRSGFDSESSFLGTNPESIIEEVEEYANEYRSTLEGTSYQNMEKFKFKPGHKTTIFHLTNQVKLMKKLEADENPQSRMSDFSLILRTFVETAESNHGRHSNALRYNEINRYFSTFIYLFCGGACYETLSANLPIPQAATIRKFFQQAIIIPFSLKSVI